VDHQINENAVAGGGGWIFQ